MANHSCYVDNAGTMLIRSRCISYARYDERLMRCPLYMPLWGVVVSREARDKSLLYYVSARLLVTSDPLRAASARDMRDSARSRKEARY